MKGNVREETMENRDGRIVKGRQEENRGGAKRETRKDNGDWRGEREGIINKRDMMAIGRLQMRIAFTFLCGSIPSRRPAAHSSKWGAVNTTGTFWFGPL